MLCVTSTQGDSGFFIGLEKTSLKKDLVMVTGNLKPPKSCQGSLCVAKLVTLNLRGSWQLFC